MKDGRDTMKTIGFIITALLGVVLPAAAQADRLDLSALVEGRAGYGTNPYLNSGGNAGSGLVGFTIAPNLTMRGATATTELSGSYNRDQYFTKYGHADDYDIELRHKKQFSAKLSGNARVGYFSSISGLLSPYYSSVAVDPGAVDQLAVGTRERRIYGDAGLDWQPNSRDAFSISGLAQRETYSRFGGDYTYYAGTGGYSRAIDARTRVGVQLTGGVTSSDDFADGTSIQPSVTLQRTLSAHWTFNGSVGVIIENQRLAGRSRTSVSPGFTGTLCGTYPRTTFCVSASRSSAPSALGGLRRATQISANINYNLTPRSHILAAGTYGISTTEQGVIVNGVDYGRQRYALARLDYQRDLTQRISAGVGGSYQGRSGRNLPDVHALAITFNLTAKLGRLS